MINKLEDLLIDVGGYKLYGNRSLGVSGIADDSRKVKKDYVFVAIKGVTLDAYEFIPLAINSGAKVVVGEIEPKKEWLKKITYLKVLNSRRTLSLLASGWYGNPSKKLKIIGVTGTDGKTTTASIISHILNNAGKKTGLITTVSAKIGDKEYDTGFHVTNPEPLLLQEFLAKMVKENCEYAVLEVTSHGLNQERVAGIDFEIGVLTNVTREHLDYHKTYKSYLKAKLKLFNNSRIAILNKEDKSFKLVRKYMNTNIGVITYDRNLLKGKLKQIVKKRFPESYNQLNATAAVLVARKLNVSGKIIASAIASFPEVEGRMEEVKNNKGFRIYIDFAHTPNSLENVLKALKSQLKKGNKLIVVFGCAGERDAGKRPEMAKISTKLADISVFTAEDPRDENVNDIIGTMSKAALKSGATEFLWKDSNQYRCTDNGTIKSKSINNNYNNKGKCFVKIPERGEAIAFAIQKLARKGDTVVICGKGHEKSMAYNGIEYPWSDHVAVRVALKGGMKKIKRV